MVEVFAEWVRLNEENPAEKYHATFVAKLQHNGFLKVKS